ncbi:MAG: cytochrome c oxidase assembly protein CtaG/Cox11 [Polaromonas sp.]|nr:cytochrome c oxidase assembly protein CtaG/Cox11 [Polaromonas sp.]
MQIKRENVKMVGKLGVIVLGMFAFGYALVPIYKAICEMTGINVLALSDRRIPGATSTLPANTQVDRTRTIKVEFDANSRGPWHFKPAQSSLTVHPGELATMVYEFQNVQDRTMSAQAIPSYAPSQAGAHFNKLECFCFTQYTLQPGEKKQWPVAFVIDPKLSRDVTTITLSYTFFEVGGKTPAAPQAAVPKAVNLVSAHGVISPRPGI